MTSFQQGIDRDAPIELTAVGTGRPSRFRNIWLYVLLTAVTVFFILQNGELEQQVATAGEYVFTLLLFGFIRGKRGSNRFGPDPRRDDMGMAA